MFNRNVESIEHTFRTHIFSISKNIISCTFLIVFKSRESLQYILKLLLFSSKNKVLFAFGDLYANKAHYFFLEVVSLIQIVSENLVLRFSNLLAMIPCFM